MKRFHVGSMMCPLLAAGILLLAAGCDDFSVYEAFPLAANGGGSSGELTLYPEIVAVPVNGDFRFDAWGGTPPYFFSMESGSGWIDSLTGEYHAPSVSETTLVRVTDASGDTRESIVTVVAGTQLRISPDTLYMNVDHEYTFTATGGTPPYSYSAAGGGTIETGTGVYTAPSGPASVIISVTDSIGTITGATVHVVAAGALGINPLDPEVEEGTAITFMGYGGTPPYFFSLLSGSLGSIGSGNGAYTAPAIAGENLATVLVTDSLSASECSVITVVPRSPGNLAADGRYGGPQEIRITWTDRSVVEEGYLIERKIDSSGEFSLIATVGPDMEDFVDSGLNPNTAYIYRVRAYRGSLKSPGSNEAFALSNS